MNKVELYKRLRVIGLSVEESLKEVEGLTDQKVDCQKPLEEELVCKTVNGNKYWYNKQGELHREDGPAIKCPDGTKEWYINGELHREDGPAIEWANGIKKWYINHKLHRENGPAIEWANGTKYWYYHGELISVSSQKEFERYLKLKMFW